MIQMFAFSLRLGTETRTTPQTRIPRAQPMRRRLRVRRPNAHGTRRVVRRVPEGDVGRARGVGGGGLLRRGCPGRATACVEAWMWMITLGMSKPDQRPRRSCVLGVPALCTSGSRRDGPGQGHGYGAMKSRSSRGNLDPSRVRVWMRT